MECEQLEENIIIGRNTVREAIKSGREIDCLYVAKGQNDGSIREILALARKRGVVIKEAPRSKLDELSMPFGYGGKTGNHQGLAAMLPSIQYAGIEDIFAKAEADPESWKETLSKYPMGRIAAPEEIARGALFLATDDSSFVTGTTLTIDGGFTCL